MPHIFPMSGATSFPPRRRDFADEGKQAFQDGDAEYEDEQFAAEDELVRQGILPEVAERVGAELYEIADAEDLQQQADDGGVHSRRFRDVAEY